jgi:hypothetical protein
VYDARLTKDTGFVYYTYGGTDYGAILATVEVKEWAVIAYADGG